MNMNMEIMTILAVKQELFEKSLPPFLVNKRYEQGLVMHVLGFGLGLFLNLH